ncbi:LssY C-terminal domain-containing protein [Methyloceanibacter marginalis]|uniref:LssY C-terminal domain-containing protein n=1 Tax=Methyloceanibacter marginalis TaxID=1774971 RepID=UPI00313A14F9
MAKTFVLNQPYPTAPFSTLFLFGRGQDIGFQKAIGDSRASGITYDSGRSPRRHRKGRRSLLAQRGPAGR